MSVCQRRYSSSTSYQTKAMFKTTSQKTTDNKLWKFALWVLYFKVAFVLVYNNPNVETIPDTQLNRTFTGLNKFGNDTSSCPTSPTQIIQVRSKG